MIRECHKKYSFGAPDESFPNTFIMRITEWIEFRGMAFMSEHNRCLEIPIFDARNQLFDRANENRTIVRPDDGGRSRRARKRSLPITQDFVSIDATTSR